MSFIYAERVAHIEGLPDMHLAFCVTGGNKLTIGRPRHRFDPRVVAAIGIDLLAGQSMPDLHRPIVAGRSNKLAVRRPGDSIDLRVMACIGDIEGRMKRWWMPDLHRSVGGGNVVVITRPCYGENGAIIRIVNAEAFIAIRIEDLRHLAIAPHHDILAIGGPRHASYAAIWIGIGVIRVTDRAIAEANPHRLYGAARQRSWPGFKIAQQLHGAADGDGGQDGSCRDADEAAARLALLRCGFLCGQTHLYLPLAVDLRRGDVGLDEAAGRPIDGVK